MMPDAEGFELSPRARDAIHSFWVGLGSELISSISSQRPGNPERVPKVSGVTALTMADKERVLNYPQDKRRYYPGLAQLFQWTVVAGKGEIFALTMRNSGRIPYTGDYLPEHRLTATGFTLCGEHYATDAQAVAVSG